MNSNPPMSLRAQFLLAEAQEQEIKRLELIAGNKERAAQVLRAMIRTLEATQVSLITQADGDNYQ